MVSRIKPTKVLNTMISSVILNTLKTTFCLIIPHGMFSENNAFVDTYILLWDVISLSVEKNVVLQRTKDDNVVLK